MAEINAVSLVRLFTGPLAALLKMFYSKYRFIAIAFGWDHRCFFGMRLGTGPFSRSSRDGPFTILIDCHCARQGISFARLACRL